MLWHPQAVFNNVCALIVDEGFLSRAIRPPLHITLDALRAMPIGPNGADDPAHQTTCETLARIRSRLVQAIEAQRGDLLDGTGGLKRERLRAAGLSGDLCQEAYRLEWSLKAKTKLCWPNMPPEARKIATKAAPGAQLIRQHCGPLEGPAGVPRSTDRGATGRDPIQRTVGTGQTHP